MTIRLQAAAMILCLMLAGLGLSLFLGGSYRDIALDTKQLGPGSVDLVRAQQMEAASGRLFGFGNRVLGGTSQFLATDARHSAQEIIACLDAITHSQLLTRSRHSIVALRDNVEELAEVIQEASLVHGAQRHDQLSNLWDRYDELTTRHLEMQGALLKLMSAESEARQAHLEERRLQLEHWAQLGGGAYILLIFLLWRLSSQNLVRPLQALTRAAQRGVAIPASAGGPTEVRRLAACFRLQVNNLVEAKASVERVVAERTAELERANQAKTTFLANMSHELRTPLNGVLGTLSLLSETRLDGEQGELVAVATSSAEAQLQLINDVLDLTRVESGRIELEEAEFDLHDLVQSVVRMLADTASAKGVTISAEIDPQVPQAVLGDALRLRQVLTNLAGNAIKFTEDGTIAVRCREAELTDQVWRLRFEVQDSGIGIPEEARGRLFQTFSQVDASTTRRYGGSGLGLAICRQLVELMGGHIGVDSVEGQGSTFHFDILVGEARWEPGAAAGQAEQPLDAPGPDLSVLLAEDNPVNQLVTRRMLEKAGYTCDVVENGQLALDALTARPYALLILDGNMPVMDGLTAAREVRERERAGQRFARDDQRLPILALTANAWKTDRQRFLDAGMDDYVPKPVHREELLRAVRDLVLSTTGAVDASDAAATPSEDQALAARRELRQDAVEPAE